MKELINAEVLAQIAANKIDDENVEALMGRNLNQAVVNDESFTALDKLRVVNTLKVASSAAVESIRPVARKQFEELYGADFIGAKPFRNGLFKRYETYTYTWENVHLPELTDEKKSKMTSEEIRLYERARTTLDEHHALFDKVKALEKDLAQEKPKLKGLNESLAAMMPKSKAIHPKVVFQVLQGIEVE